MKAWEVRGGELGMRDVEPPHPRAGEIVVRVSYAGLCRSDLPKLLRPADFALTEPWRPGHEIVGTEPEGRMVAVDPLVPCGDCALCATGNTHLCPNLRRLGWDLPGGFGQQVVAPAANTHPLPDDLDPLHAVLADPAAVAIHGLRCNRLGKPGLLAVVGAGTVGLLTALYAFQQGWEVTIVHRDGRPPHKAVAQTIPAVFRSPSSLSEHGTFDAVVDAAIGADPGPLGLALRLVRDVGTVVVQNAYHPAVRLPSPLRNVFRRSIHLIGSFSYCRHDQPGDFTLALAFLREHRGPVGNLVAEAGCLVDLRSILVDRRRPVVRRALAVT